MTVKVGVSSGLISYSLRPIAVLETVCDYAEKVVVEEVSQNAVYLLLFDKLEIKPNFFEK